MADVMVKYYSLKKLQDKSISNKTKIDELGEATKEDTIPWDTLKSMDSKQAFEYLKTEMKLENPNKIKGCRFLSDKQIMFVARKEKKDGRIRRQCQSYSDSGKFRGRKLVELKT